MKFQLTWFEPRKCWKKYLGGKVHYLGKGKCSGKYDMGGYHAAMDEWKSIEGKAREEAEVAELFEKDPAVIEQIHRAHSNKRIWAEKYPNLTYEEAKYHEAALETHRRVNVEIPREKSVQWHIDSFIKSYTAKVSADQKSPGRLRNIRLYLNRFAEFVGKEKALETITAVTLAEYHAHLVMKITNNLLGEPSARDSLQAAKQFIRRLAGMAVIAMPPNINSKDLEIRVAPSEIEIWDFDALKGVLKAAPEPLRLHLLLMANCGMTQKDVSDLLPQQVDWEAGVIRRKRSKTKRWDNVPMVSYKLWDETITLLKRHGKGEGVRVLTAPDGTALVYDALSAAGKGSKNDKINESWHTWLRTARVPHPKGLADIRKTSASKLGSHDTHSRYAQHFLGQSPRTVADRHYVQPSQKQFDKAIVWLGKQYGMGVEGKAKILQSDPNLDPEPKASSH